MKKIEAVNNNESYFSWDMISVRDIGYHEEAAVVHFYLYHKDLRAQCYCLVGRLEFFNFIQAMELNKYSLNKQESKKIKSSGYCSFEEYFDTDMPYLFDDIISFVKIRTDIVSVLFHIKNSLTLKLSKI